MPAVRTTRKVPIARLEVGAILAEPIVRAVGHVLLAQGTRIDAATLEMLKLRGVAMVTIEAESSGQEANSVEPSAERLRAIAVETADRFQGARKHPLMAEVFRWAVQYRAGQVGVNDEG